MPKLVFLKLSFCFHFFISYFIIFHFISYFILYEKVASCIFIRKYFIQFYYGLILTIANLSLSYENLCAHVRDSKPFFATKTFADFHKRSPEWCYRGAAAPPNGRSPWHEECPRAKLGIAARYNRVSSYYLIGHFGILLNPIAGAILCF